MQLNGPSSAPEVGDQSNKGRPQARFISLYSSSTPPLLSLYVGGGGGRGDPACGFSIFYQKMKLLIDCWW